eukprot:CAMPEP_0181480368 /NCGR_PEP_ID=MMETSP1110-20121109/43765_1 /TAXON_ID=174948 /ORGANISM="Symbiodinium sp., Strain CCMP421" /LENGTH=134 /DNA_ID=CAMNT_0023605837 /DNA_START=188 /DNA_END=589 /DNA_ORIENTATION=+
MCMTSFSRQLSLRKRLRKSLGRGPIVVSILAIFIIFIAGFTRVTANRLALVLGGFSRELQDLRHLRRDPTKLPLASCGHLGVKRIAALGVMVMVLLAVAERAAGINLEVYVHTGLFQTTSASPDVTLGEALICA